MQSLVDQLRAQIDKSEFEDLVQKKLGEYHHLVTVESAQYLVALEKLGVQTEVQTIEQAKMKAAPSILHVKIKRIFLPQIFRRGVQESRTQRIEAQDESSKCTVVVYDELAKELENSALNEDIVEIGPLKFRGREFHAISGAQIKRMQKGPRCRLADERQLLANFEGKITDVTGDFEYKIGQSSLSGKANTQIATSFEIDDGTGAKRVVFWNSGGIEKKLQKGMRIEIENGLRKNGEIHIGNTARLVYKQIKEKRPTIREIRIEDEKVFIYSDGKTVVFDDLNYAAHKFGIGSIPDGINPRTALELKVPDLIGKEVPKEWENS